MRVCLLTLFVVPFLAVVPEVEKDVGDITGIYHVTGTDGKEDYDGVATIRKINDVYLVNWLTGSPSQGIGNRLGDTFSVGWRSLDGKVLGVTTYRITAGPRLTGRWVSNPGTGQANQETLHFLKALKE